MDEVVVTNRKVKDTILPSLSRTTKKVKVKSWSSNENTLYATFVPNMNGVNAVINKIIVEPGKGQYGDPNKQFIPFKVNLFYMNDIDSLPKDKVLSQSILLRHNRILLCHKKILFDHKRNQPASWSGQRAQIPPMTEVSDPIGN